MKPIAAIIHGIDESTPATWQKDGRKLWETEPNRFLALDGEWHQICGEADAAKFLNGEPFEELT